VSSGRPAWGKAQRLLRAPEFACLAGPQANWRAARRWLALSVRIQMPESGSTERLLLAIAARAASPDPHPPRPLHAVRFGLTTSKRQAKRAVARNLVKRVLREAARHAAMPLEAVAQDAQVDVLFRLKSPLPAPSAAGWSQVKASLRQEADSLLQQLAAELERRRGRPPGPRGNPQGAAQVLAQSPAGAQPATGQKGAA
jgi:ribonuclease P protein component